MVNSVELPGLDPDDLMDTGTRTPFDPDKPGPLPQEQSTSEAKKSESRGTVSPADQETVVITNRRKSAPIAKELLSGTPVAAPRSALKSKPLWVVAGVLVILILLLSHMKGGSDPTVVGDNLEPATSVPLLPIIEARTAAPVPVAAPTTPAAHSAEPTGDSGRAAVSARPNRSEAPAAAKREPSRSFKTPSGAGNKANVASSSVPSTPVSHVTGVTPVIQPE